MATKAQERAALEKIRKIVDGLGEESYIGKAFEGCFDVAADNIDNDFWNSPMASAQELNRKLDMAAGKLNDKAEEIGRLKEQVSENKQEATHWFNLYNTLKTNADTAKLEAHNSAAELQRKVEAQELEIMKLKAKLYDMMVGA